MLIHREFYIYLKLKVNDKFNTPQNVGHWEKSMTQNKEGFWENGELQNV